MSSHWLVSALALVIGALGVVVVAGRLRERASEGAASDAKKLIENLRLEIKTLSESVLALTGRASKAEGEAVGLRQTVEMLRAVVTRDQAKMDERDRAQDEQISVLNEQLADVLTRATTQPPVVSAQDTALAGKAGKK